MLVSADLCGSLGNFASGAKRVKVTASGSAFNALGDISFNRGFVCDNVIKMLVACLAVIVFGGIQRNFGGAERVGFHDVLYRLNLAGV